MNAGDAPTDSLELGGTTPHEIERDEDVLSLGLQRDLESVGSGVGFVAALALVLSHLPRALRMIRAHSAPTARATTTAKPEASHG